MSSGELPAGPPVPVTPTASAGEDVIHDIGFRHYNGVRFGRGWIVRSLLVETVRGIFGLGRPAKSKIMPWVLFGILLLPPLIIALWVILTRGKDLPLSYTGYLSSMQFVIALFVAGAAPYCVSRDLRHGVMPLYLSRPMKRSDYALAKFGGLSIGLFLVLAVPETLLLLGAVLAKLSIGHQLAGWASGIAISAVLALALSAISLVIAAFTPRRGLGVAAIVTTLVVVSGLSFVLSGIAGEKGYQTLSDYVAMLDPFRLVDGLAVAWFGVSSSSSTAPPPGALGGTVFALVAAALVGGGVAILVRRYRKVGVV
jgi:ABC-2 type transport system permease protein